MTYKAHPYQEVATRFIEEHETACLILDMGLGKTVITLTALWNLILDSFEVKPRFDHALLPSHARQIS